MAVVYIPAQRSKKKSMIETSRLAGLAKKPHFVSRGLVALWLKSEILEKKIMLAEIVARIIVFFIKTFIFIY